MPPHGTGNDAALPFDVGDALAALGDDSPEEKTLIDRQKKLIGQWFDAGIQTSRAFWAYVMSRGHLAIGDWKFVADPTSIKLVLELDGEFRVSEYDRRMRPTAGRFFLGMDGSEHDREVKTRVVVPGLKHNDVKTGPCPAELESIQAAASRATTEFLRVLGARTRLARQADKDAPCQCQLRELLGPVFNKSSEAAFGVTGPSAYSFLQWARDITWYFFRVQATDDLDRTRAQEAAIQLKAHVISLIADMPASDPTGRLQTTVNEIREVLIDSGDAHPSDDDVARNLVGIMLGSLTATAKGFGEALVMFGLQSGTGRINWQIGAPQSKDAAFPLYEQVVAATLSRSHRGSLDAIYRVYHGPGRTLPNGLELKQGETVIVWLGAMVAQDPEHMFGIGRHACPGKAMGKAIMEGVLRALHGVPKAPSIVKIDGEVGLEFDLESISPTQPT